MLNKELLLSSQEETSSCVTTPVEGLDETLYFSISTVGLDLTEFFDLTKYILDTKAYIQFYDRNNPNTVKLGGTPKLGAGDTFLFIYADGISPDASRYVPLGFEHIGPYSNIVATDNDGNALYLQNKEYIYGVLDDKDAFHCPYLVLDRFDELLDSIVQDNALLDYKNLNVTVTFYFFP